MTSRASCVGIFRKFRDLNIETGGRVIEDVAPVDALPRFGEAPETPQIGGGEA